MTRYIYAGQFIVLTSKSRCYSHNPGRKNFKNSDNTSDPSLLLTSWQTFLVPQVIGISIAENGKYS